MSLLLAIRKPVNPNDYLAPSRQVLWPQFADRYPTGTWAWAADAGAIWGGLYRTASTGGSLEFDNVVLNPGNYYVKVFCFKTTAYGVYTMYVDGVSTGLTFNFYSAGTDRNAVIEVPYTFSGASGKHTVSFVGANGAGGTAYSGFKQIEIVKATNYSGNNSNLLPAWNDIPPAMYSSSTATPAFNISSTYQWGTRMRVVNGGGTLTNYGVWFPGGDASLTVVQTLQSAGGIVSVKVDGVEVATINSYDAGAIYSDFSTVSLGTVSPGMHTLTFEGKSAGTGGSCITYLQWLRVNYTTIDAPIGETFGNQSCMFYPWFEDSGEGKTAINTAAQSHYGYYYNNPASISDKFEFLQNLQAGTYQLIHLGLQAGAGGIVSFDVDGGSDLGQVDLYSGSLTYNVLKTATLAGFTPGNLRAKTATKNTLSSNYINYCTYMRTVRTGD